ncbi:S8 family peptidase [Pseudoduganella umbonata]|uniref:Peptidase S8 n=1 Tax=Pseudoduganella umbonata TaxID=864828 RepID=A0A4P8HIX6_9BURK|nr:S8 family peptidase [Pseudoduganella umbonata]MBB3219567.1 hypothetical protein [Pseudoduganella umbonata]QCP09639.1 peptidase S8 [Pseudoduganella umbonata]
MPDDPLTPLARDLAYMLVYAGCEPEPGRFTSDLPVGADVWLHFSAELRFDGAASLLLTPHCDVDPATLRQAVARSLHRREEDAAPVIASNESHLLARLDFFGLLRLLPLTAWWRRHAGRPEDADAVAAVLRSDRTAQELGSRVLEHLASVATIGRFKDVGRLVADTVHGAGPEGGHGALVRLVNVAALYVGLGLLGVTRDSIGEAALQARLRGAARAVLRALADCCDGDRHGAGGLPPGALPPLWHIARNRPARHAIAASRRTVKADAASRVFDTGGRGVRWAVVDSGIDASHPAFARDGGGPAIDAADARRSRIVQTMDFTRLADLTAGTLPKSVAARLAKQPDGAALLERAARLGRDLAAGRMLDWSLLEPLLAVSHAPGGYAVPPDSHGTHVAGILGAGWYGRHYLERGMPLPPELADSTDLLGICPAIELLDLRVFDADGDADEFTILAALQYVRYLNQSRDRQYVHGVNISLSLHHSVRSYGCGSTPVCLECDRLAGSGVVVVAAAGNCGFDEAYARTSMGGAYRGQSLTDPGNARAAITVGATHRSDPHLYGVSYFSSRGPTGDGRAKPDLVAPGEKITSTAPGAGTATMDGTSMAAPHVSGVAALLLARHPELMGHPGRVKDVLRRSATDLGREPAFQGCGLVDALRALQAV